MKVAPVLKYPGAKWNLANWIISQFPTHTTYLEPFFGSGAVFFNKPPSNIETINDLDGNVVNLFKVIREHPDELARLVELTPWARDEYYASYEKTGNEIEDARRFLVRCWQAFGTKTGTNTGWRCDISSRGNMYLLSQWSRMHKEIAFYAERLKNVQIENQPAVQLIKRYSALEVLIYADPPYPLITRASKMYTCEMTDHDHLELLEALQNHPGPVILSGYECDLYNKNLVGWEKKSVKALAERGQIRREVVWINNIAKNNQGLFV